MAELAPLILKRIEGQYGSHRVESGIAIVFDMDKLPTMTEVTDWSISGTRQWNKEALTGLQQTPAYELGQGFAESDDAWIHMAAIAEIAMHGEDARAREFTRGLLEKNPEAELYLLDYFGDDIVEYLKKKE